MILKNTWKSKIKLRNNHKSKDNYKFNKQMILVIIKAKNKFNNH